MRRSADRVLRRRRPDRCDGRRHHRRGSAAHLDERRSLAEAFVAAAGPRLDIVVHAGAQSTAETAAIAAHARDIGARAVAVIAPPYYRLDDESVLEHLATAAAACTPTPFYVYEFADRSGYAVPVEVLSRLADRVDTFVA